MPSASLNRWRTERLVSLDEIETAHASLGGTGRGRRYATQQVNHAYVVLLSSQFQGFCRDLHSESVDYLLSGVSDPALRAVLGSMTLSGRRLDKGNADPGSIGADFGAFGFKFWEAVYARDQRNKGRKEHLDSLNDWRNAIAHQDFTPSKLAGRTEVQLREIRQWRQACNGLSASFDAVMRERVFKIIGNYPW